MRSASSVYPQYAAEIARREYAHSRGQPPPSVPVGPDTRALSASDTARVCAELAFRYLKAHLTGDAAAISEIDGEFIASTCDPAWATTIKEYLSYFGPGGARQQIPYIRASMVGPRTLEMKVGACLAIVGDWGTGAQPAIQILKAIANHKPDSLIHLGDIYYSGTPLECGTNFSSLIESVLRSRNPTLAVYTLAGNHDMYCGGIGYYQLIKQLNESPQTQPASFFCLRSSDERWQLLAMDTGLHDYSPLGVDDAVTFVEPDELEWHSARIREFSGRSILLSHHQLFSAFSPIGKRQPDGKQLACNPHLLNAYRTLSQIGSIAAWYWGHEHTLSIYQPFAGLQRGRCLGHGAVPVSLLDKIYEPVDGLDQTPTLLPNTRLNGDGDVYAHGYAILRFEQASCLADYYQFVGDKSTLLYSESIQ
jgi:hypothetical protein